jgi:alpha-1,2-mannosyltransferase
VTQAATSRRRARGVEVALFLVTFLVFGATASRTYISYDVWTSNLASYELATTGSPYIDGLDVPDLEHHPLRWVWIDDDAPNGHVVITRAPAVVIAGLPAYLLTQPDSMTVLPAAITAALLTATAVLLMYLALLHLMRRRHALIAAAAFAFTTPVWSVAANGIWPQTITVLGIALTAWAAVRDRWWTVGLGGILMLWARPHAALIVAVLGLTLAWRRRSLGITLRTGLPGLASLAPLALWTHWVYGTWNPTALYGAGALSEVHKSLLDLPNQAGMWISPDRGILIYTPALLLLLPTLIRTWHTLPDWATALLLGGLAYTVLQAALIGFTGGDPIYGYRYGLELLTCATPAYALATPHAHRTTRLLLTPLLGLQLTVIALGAVVERVALDYRLAWTHNAFLHAMAVGSPALRLSALLVTVLTVFAVRLVRTSGLHPDVSQESETEPVTVG